LVRFWETRFRPNNATIIVAGDITLTQIRAELETVFAGWTPARVPAKNSLKVDPAPKSSIYLVDKPGARQSFVLAAVPGISIRDARQPAAEAMNDALGGNHSSRLNLDLREEKHWTYGVRSRFIDARESRPLVLYASVQGERTADAIKEMKKQFTALWSTQPVSREELQEVKANQISRLEVSQQTLDGTADLLLQPLELGLSEHYYESLPEKIATLRPEDIKDAAEALLQPERIVWVVVGDRQKLESSIREAGIGEVRVMPLKPAQAVRLFQLPEVSAHSR
jgi:zinc protease